VWGCRQRSAATRLAHTTFIRLTDGGIEGLMVNWNRVNNELSEAVLRTGRLEGLLAELGSDVCGDPGGAVFRGPCPVHKGDGKNFEVRTDGHTLPINWRCFSHGCHRRKKIKENLLGLVRGALPGDPDRPVPLPQAQRFVEDFLTRAGASTDVAVTRPVPLPRRKALALTREQVRTRLLVPSPYFLARGFRADVLDALDVGESARLGRAVVPVYDDLGSTCVGAVSRSVHPTCTRCGRCHRSGEGCGDGEDRWRFLPGFARGEWLYNSAAARRSPSPYVLLVEGVPDVLRAAEAGVPAVAGFGTGVTVTHRLKLAALGKEVVVAFDNDERGRTAAAEVTKLLRREGVKAVVRHPPAGVKDVGEMAAADVAEWLCAFGPTGLAG
jgi:hypothetical protein